MPREKYYEGDQGGNKLADDWKQVPPLTPDQFWNAAASDNVEDAIANANGCGVPLAMHDHLADNDRRNQEGPGSNCKGFKHTLTSAAANHLFIRRSVHGAVHG
jgi:hypothetical protein